MKNALEASPEGGEVRVTLHHVSDADGDCVELAVHNAGEVPAAVRERFFEKYATHGKAGGTGLGAYSARLMARVQRGSLRMASGPEGTTLSLRLPARHAAVPRAGRPGAGTGRGAAHRAAAGAVGAGGGRRRIQHRRPQEPAAQPAADGAHRGQRRAALELAREARADVIFLDPEMPVMGGIEAARRIQALQLQRGEEPSRIAAFSAYDDEGTRRQCLQSGFDLYRRSRRRAKRCSRCCAGRTRHAPAAGERRDQGGGRAGGAGPDAPDARVPVLAPPDGGGPCGGRRDGEREAIRVTAHKLAGSPAMYGFRDASRVSRALEQAAESRRTRRAARTLRRARRLLAQAQPEARPATSANPSTATS